MKVTKRSNFVLLAGASAFALSIAAPAAVAQDDGDDSARTLTTVVVTTQKKAESIQDVPIAVSAFDEAALEKLQLAGGPDLVKTIPNVSFSKGNFAGYNFKVRGIGNDAVAQSGDNGVGVHQNDVPLTANRLFEAEFFDVERVETLRGPQGTLYGRNATGGVINVITAKPVMEEFQANAQLTYGNYNTIKAKGMLNVPLGDKVAVRVAGSMLQRDGYVTNAVTGSDIDDRDLFGIRGTIAFEPNERLSGFFMVEHFEEDDSRLRTGKQLCDKDPGFSTFNGLAVSALDQRVTSLGCQDSPLSQSLDRVNSAATLGGGLGVAAGLLNGDAFTTPLIADFRTIESAFEPSYQAEATLFTWQAKLGITDNLSLTYLGSYNEDRVVSAEDYNKIAPNVTFNDLSAIPPGLSATADIYNAVFPGGVVNDPQLGASNIFRTFDLSGGNSEQETHELRLQSDNDGPFNFNLGFIKVDFEAIDPFTAEDGYYVLSNTLTGLTQLHNALVGFGVPGGALGFSLPVPIDDGVGEGAIDVFGGSLVGDGGNYFRSLSPYKLDSTALFGEVYYDLTDTLQVTGGLRYTKDKKEQSVVPTYLFTPSAAYPAVQVGDPRNPTGILQVEFEEVTGRFGFDWSPDLSWSEDSLFYAFYSRGYKGGGLNPPQPAGADLFPQTFEPEFIDSYEVGAKNTLAGGALQLNASAFLYNYEGYQITQIINRSSVNFNVDAELKGLEIESVWNPVSTLLLTANLGLLDSEIQDTFGIDVLNRTNGRSDLITIKNAANFSNCVVSAQGFATILGAIAGGALPEGATRGLCSGAFAGAETAFGVGNVTYVDRFGQTQTVGGLTPFDGEAQDLSGNSIPGAPDTTLSFGAEYTWDSLGDGPWEITARGDFYTQGESFSRVWNTGRDALDSWSNVNLSITLVNTDNDLQIELFGKNVTDEEVITGAYLTDDSSGLFTNIFLTDPSTYGITVRKSW